MLLHDADVAVEPIVDALLLICVLLRGIERRNVHGDEGAAVEVLLQALRAGRFLLLLLRQRGWLERGLLLVEALGTVPLVHVLRELGHVRLDHRLLATVGLPSRLGLLVLLVLFGEFLQILAHASLLNRCVPPEDRRPRHVIRIDHVPLLELLHLLEMLLELLLCHERLLLVHRVIGIMILIQILLGNLLDELLMDEARLPNLLVDALYADVVDRLPIHQVLRLLLTETCDVPLNHLVAPDRHYRMRPLVKVHFVIIVVDIGMMVLVGFGGWSRLVLAAIKYRSLLNHLHRKLLRPGHASVQVELG